MKIFIIILLIILGFFVWLGIAFIYKRLIDDLVEDIYKDTKFELEKRQKELKIIEKEIKEIRKELDNMEV